MMGFKAKGVCLALLTLLFTACANDSDFESQGVWGEEDLGESAEGLLESSEEISVSLENKILLSNTGIRPDALRRAVDFFNAKPHLFSNKRYMAIVDYGLHSREKRFHVINLQTGEVEALHTSHGSNSDRNNDGYAESFSNINSSHQSSLGFVRTTTTYYGRNGYSLKLDGLENRNSNVLSRYIVIHGATYVGAHLSKMGLSWGCPALPVERTRSVIDQLKHGALVYLYHPNSP